MLSSSCKSISIDVKDSEAVPNMPSALMVRLVSVAVEHDYWRLLMRGLFSSLKIIMIIIIIIKVRV